MVQHPHTPFLLSLSSAWLLAPALAAQVPTYVYSPDAQYETACDSQGSNVLGSTPSGRTQRLDRSLGSSSRTLKEIAFRRAIYSAACPGRSFKNVTLDLSHFKGGSLSTTFSNNVATPTQVFSSPVAWPDLGVAITSMPTFSITFPFTTGFKYLGSASGALLADFGFVGGTLSNGVSWPEGRRQSYILDSYSGGSYAFSSGQSLGLLGRSGGCADSGATTTFGGAYTGISCYVYNSTYPTVGYRGHFRLFGFGHYLGRNTTAYSYLSLSGLAATPWNLPGLSCTKVFLDPTVMHVTSVKTDSSGHTGEHNFGVPSPGLIPYDSSFAGYPLAQQFAWADTVTGKPRATTASWLVIPKLPHTTSTTATGAECVWATTGTATTGTHHTNTYCLVARYAE